MNDLASFDLICDCVFCFEPASVWFETKNWRFSFCMGCWSSRKYIPFIGGELRFVSKEEVIMRKALDF